MTKRLVAVMILAVCVSGCISSRRHDELMHDLRAELIASLQSNCDDKVESILSQIDDQPSYTQPIPDRHVQPQYPHECGTAWVNGQELNPCVGK